MKKTVYPLVMAALAAFPVLFSCTEKEQEVSVDNHRYEYRFSLAEDATRALLNDEGVFWEADDNVGLFTGAAQSLEAKVDAESSPKTIVVQTADPLAEGTTVYAYYPYVEGNTDVMASKVVFPAEQSGGALSAMPLAGIPTAVHIDSEPSTIGVIRFLNLGSIIDFRVYSSTYAGETVESVALQANTGNLAGTAAIDLTGVSWNETDETATIPALTWANGAGSSTVTLTQSAPVATDKNAAIAGGHLYMVVAPGTYSGTITVTTNAARYTFPFTNKELFLNGLKRFNMNLDNATEREDRFVTINLEEATELVAGEKYVLVSNGFALVRDGGNASVAAFNANDLTVSVLDDLQENFEWTLQSSSNNNLFKNGDYYFGIIMHATGTYTYRVGLSTTTTNVDGVSVDRMPLHTIDIANDYIYYSGSSSAYFIYYNTSSNQWDNAKITKANSYTHDNKTTLYKVKDMRAEQNPQFSTATAEYDLYTNAWTIAVPTLSGAETTVTYSSSDETVATVDADGTVHPLSVGTTTITATAAGSAEYQGASATYTLTVTNSDPNKLYYNKITSLEDIEDEATYLIVYEDGNMAFKPVLSGSNFVSGDAQNAVSVTIESDKIEANETVEPCQIVLKKDSGSNYYIMVLQDGGSYLYLVPTRSGSGWSYTYSFAAQYSPVSTTFSLNNSLFTISANNSSFNVNSGKTFFRANSSSTPLALYMLEDPRAEQDLAFSAEEAEYDLGASTWTKAVPTLTGTPQGDVTYSSSDESVATVTDAGVVTPLKKGTTTITAHASGNDSYKPAQASFELTVVNSSEVPSIYTKVTSADDLEEGAKYLVVYESIPKVFKPILNGSSFETATGNAIDVSISDNEISSADLADCELTLESGYYLFVGSAERYLYVTNGSIGAEENKGSSHSLSVSISNGTASISRTSNNQVYYLRYSASNSYFQSSTSTANVALYKLDDGQPKAQHLAFSDETVTFNIFGIETPVALTEAPTLSGAKTTVSWNSSNQNVAEVDGDGIVTVKAVGTTTITATAAAEGRYLSGTASYVLTVTNEAPPTYTKVTSITSGATYLIVSADAGNYNGADGTKAFTGDQNGTAATVNNAAGVITGDYSAYEFVISASGSDYTLLGPNGYVTGNANSGSRYIQVSSTAGTMSLSMASDFTGTDGQVADAFYFYYSKTQGTTTTKEVLYFNADGAFKVGGTGRKYGVYLYKKN